MNDDLQFKVGEDESSATVAIDEDGAAEVLDKPQAPIVETTSNAPAPTGELEQYSEGVKKRIDKLTARLRETQRREQAALDYAKSVQARATQLEQQYMSADSERLGEANGRIQTQVVALKQIIRKAREEGDIDTETEAQQRLTTLTLEQSQITAATQQREQQQQEWNYQQEVAAQQAAQQPQPQPVQEVDPRVEEWAERNPWYGRDTAMTHAAWGIHRQLIQVEGFGQVAIAKKLGVPLEEYAKYVK